MKKGKIVNILLLLFLGVLLFTPIGFHFKVFVNRLISWSPSEIAVEDQQILDNYNWYLDDGTGRMYNLRQARGQVVLINIWASWCPPCVAEMPDLNELYRDYGDDVIFLFVARDQQVKVDEFMAKNQYNFPVFYEKSTAPDQLQTSSLPTTFILNKKSKLVVVEKGAASWNSKATRAMIDGLLDN